MASSVHKDHSNFNYDQEMKDMKKVHGSSIDLDEKIVEENPEMMVDEDFDKDVTCKTPFKYMA